MPLENFMIHIFVLVDNFVETLGRLRRRGPLPFLRDSEVITMEIVGEFFGFGSDQQIHTYFKTHWAHWFPHLGHRTNFARRCANLCPVKEAFRKSLIKKILPFCDTFLCDGLPLPTCHKKRMRKKNPLRGQASFGFCAAKDQHYFGFKGHVLTSKEGLILDFEITPANTDERLIVPELLGHRKGGLIADKGLIGQALKEELANRGVNLQTPLRANMKDPRPKAFVKKIMDIRRNIETVLSQLAERFKIQNIKAKNMWRFNVKVGRKILAHTCCFMFSEGLKFHMILN